MFFRRPYLNCHCYVTPGNSYYRPTSDAPIATPFHPFLCFFYVLLTWCRRTDLTVQYTAESTGRWDIIGNSLFLSNPLVPMFHFTMRLFIRDGRQSTQSVVIEKQDWHTKIFSFCFGVKAHFHMRRLGQRRAFLDAFRQKERSRSLPPLH